MGVPGAMFSSSRGTHIAGPQSVNRQPNFPSRWMLDRAIAVADGERVQEALRRVFVRAVSGVDYGDVQMTRDVIGGAGRKVAHDQAIRLHGVQIERGVEK